METNTLFTKKAKKLITLFYLLCFASLVPLGYILAEKPVSESGMPVETNFRNFHIKGLPEVSANQIHENSALIFGTPNGRSL